MFMHDKVRALCWALKLNPLWCRTRPLLLRQSSITPAPISTNLKKSCHHLEAGRAWAGRSYPRDTVFNAGNQSLVPERWQQPKSPRLQMGTGRQRHFWQHRAPWSTGSERIGRNSAAGGIHTLLLRVGHSGWWGWLYSTSTPLLEEFGWIFPIASLAAAPLLAWWLEASPAELALCSEARRDSTGPQERKWLLLVPLFLSRFMFQSCFGPSAVNWLDLKDINFLAKSNWAKEVLHRHSKLATALLCTTLRS